MAQDQYVCDDSDALGWEDGPDETPHPVKPGEDFCDYHLARRTRWAEAERKADWRRRSAAPEDRDRCRGPQPYVARPRPERYHGIELTRLQARKINDKMAGVSVARAPLDSAAYSRDLQVPTAALRGLLQALNELAGAAPAVTRRRPAARTRHRDGMSSSRGPVPPSPKVVGHHDAQHPCPPETPSRLEPCPCGQMAVVVCAGCGDQVHMAVNPGTWCEHAAALA